MPLKLVAPRTNTTEARAKGRSRQVPWVRAIRLCSDNPHPESTLAFFQALLALQDAGLQGLHPRRQ